MLKKAVQIVKAGEPVRKVVDAVHDHRDAEADAMQKAPIVSLAMLVGSCGLGFAQAPAPAGDAANGYKLFMADGCYQCPCWHGRAGLRAAPRPQAGA